MNRYVVLYLVTLLVIVPIDFLFLGIVAKGFFTSQVGHHLGEIKLLPAVLFYLLYVGGTVIFVSGGTGATWQTTLLYGALFGLFAYGTYDLTNYATLKTWGLKITLVDMAWGVFVSGAASGLACLAASRLTRAFNLSL